MMEGGAGEVEGGLATVGEAVSLQRELAAGDRDAFSAALALAYGTLGSVLDGMGRSTDASGAFIEGIRVILPMTQRYPAAYVHLVLNLTKDYIASCEAMELESDSSLMMEVINVLGPYLKDEGE